MVWFHPFLPSVSCQGGEDEVISVPPQRESPQGAPSQALLSAQCHSATWNKSGLPLCGTKTGEGRPPHHPNPHTETKEVVATDLN